MSKRQRGENDDTRKTENGLVETHGSGPFFIYVN